MLSESSSEPEPTPKCWRMSWWIFSATPRCQISGRGVHGLGSRKRWQRVTVGVHAVRMRREPGVGEWNNRRRPAGVGGRRRVHRGRQGRGRHRRGCRRGRRRGREAIDDAFMLGGFEDAAQEDVLPPEGEEELNVSGVDALGRGSWRGGGGELGHCGDNRRPVGE